MAQINIVVYTDAEPLDAETLQTDADALKSEDRTMPGLRTWSG